MKLNRKFDNCKSTILMMNPLPTIPKSYGLLLQEEQQKEVPNKGQFNSESTSFTARRFADNRSYKTQYNSGFNSQVSATGNDGNQPKNYTYSMNNLFYEHCKMKNHTVDKIWKSVLHTVDIIITGSNETVITDLKSFLHTKFNIKDLGILKYFLGIEVSHTSEGYILTQRKYTK